MAKEILVKMKFFHNIQDNIEDQLISNWLCVVFKFFKNIYILKNA